MLDYLPLAVFLILVGAAVALRRKMKDPASPLGRWFERTGRSRLGQGVKVVLFLTVILWFAVYLSAPEKDRGSLSDLFGRFMNPEGKPEVEKKKAPGKRPVETPYAIPKPGPETTPPVRR